MAAKTKKTWAAPAKSTTKPVAATAPAWKPTKAATPVAPVAKPVVAAVAAPAKTVAPVAKPAVTPAAKPTVAAAPVAPVTKSAATPVAAKGTQASAAERQKMIEVAAYVIAEKNGFQGDAQKFWLQAEAEVDAKLGKK